MKLILIISPKLKCNYFQCHSNWFCSGVATRFYLIGWKAYQIIVICVAFRILSKIDLNHYILVKQNTIILNVMIIFHSISIQYTVKNTGRYVSFSPNLYSVDKEYLKNYNKQNYRRFMIDKSLIRIKGFGAQKQRLNKILWTIWFDEKIF